jgi:hypothetical protein
MQLILVQGVQVVVGQVMAVQQILGLLGHLELPVKVMPVALLRVGLVGQEVFILTLAVVDQVQLEDHRQTTVLLLEMVAQEQQAV